MSIVCITFISETPQVNELMSFWLHARFAHDSRDRILLHQYELSHLSAHLLFHGALVTCLIKLGIFSRCLRVTCAQA